MKSYPLLAFALFLLLRSPGYAQDPDEGSVEELYSSFLETYGPDQYLVCGIRYYNLHARFAGHKFFGEDKYSRGTLRLDRGTYPDVLLKYDLYGQKIIMQINYPDGSFNEIIVTDSRLLGFDLDGRAFRKISFPGTDTLIYQVIGKDSPVCLYHWTKEIIPNSTGPESVYGFSKMKRRSYVVTDSTLHGFKSARSFARCFPENRAEVMNYIRREKIRLPKAGDAVMGGLINFCSNLFKEEKE
jgi:hypothetical protein